MIVVWVLCGVVAWFWVGSLVVLWSCLYGGMLLGERVHPIFCVVVLSCLWPLVLAESAILAVRGYGPPLDS